MNVLNLASLETIADVLMGQSPSGDSTNSDGVGMPLLNGPTEFRRVSPLPVQWTSQPARLAATGDVLFCVRGSTTGRMNTADQPYAIGRGLAAIRGKQASDTEFIRYAITFTLPKLLARATGSTFPNLSRGDIGQHMIPVPAPGVRTAIAEILGALDAKIAANSRVADTADAWIRASLDGLVDGASQSIRVSELVTLRRELADPSTLDAETVYLGLEHLPRRSVWADSSGTSDAVTSTKAKFRKGDILFGKLRPYFHKVVVASSDGVCSTDILTLNPRVEELHGFALASVTSDLVVERATASSEGTRMPRTSWKDLAAIEVAWPGRVRAIEFSSRVSALRISTESLLRENKVLSTTRDALLAPLMSGELLVKEAEKVLENAGV